jgi:hypothetical protein
LRSAALLSVLLPATIAAAPAAADPIGAVTINGMPASLCPPSYLYPPSSALIGQYCLKGTRFVTITLPFQGANSNQREFAVTNRVDNMQADDLLTGVTATINPGSTNTVSTNFKGGNNDLPGIFATMSCDPFSSRSHPVFTPSFTCNARLPVDQDFSFMVYYDQVQAGSGTPVNTTDGLTSLNVEFNNGHPLSQCAFGAADGVARVADACTPPSQTRITQATITGNTALFRFTAHHATSFDCELIRKKHSTVRGSCTSPQQYANPLPRGHYVFVVTGVNKGGLDRKPAIKKFTIK